MSDCLTCNHFFECTRPQKKENKVCSDFIDIKMEGGTKVIDIVKGDSLLYSNEGALNEMTSVEVQKKELGLYDIVDDILKSNSPVLPDLQYDDSDLPRFRNFHHAVISQEGLNFTLYARQFMIGIQLLGEWCPICTPKKYHHITGVPVDFNPRDLDEVIVLLDKGRCPKCKRSKRRLLKKKVLQPYGVLAACIGQRAGKSFTMYYISAYIAMKYLLLQDPIHALKLGTGSMLTCTFTGLSFDRAVKVLWMPIRNILTKSPWFKEYNKAMLYYDNKYGVNNLKLGDLMITYGHRSIMMYPIGPNKRMLRGDSRILCGVDELGWYPLENPNSKGERERAAASEVITALDSSLLTVRTAVEKLWAKGFYDIPMAMLLATSSPQDARDKIMQMLRESVGSNTSLGVQLATWEVNPELPRDSTYISERYRTNPESAERDYGANPPRNSSPYISDLIDTAKTFDVNKSAGVVIKPIYTSRKGGLDYKSAEVVRATNSSYPSILALDAGMVKDSFAMCCMSYDAKENVRVRALLEILPDPGINIIHLPSLMRNVINKVIESQSVCLVVSDRWQQYKMLQDIEEKYKIDIDEYSLKYQDMDAFKGDLRNDESPIIIPSKNQIHSIGKDGKKKRMDVSHVEKFDIGDQYPKIFEGKPALHLAYQLIYVKDDGRTIMKSTGVTDDLLRATILCNKFIRDEDTVEKYKLKTKGVDIRKSQGVIGIKGGSGMVTSVGSSGSPIGAKGGFDK